MLVHAGCSSQWLRACQRDGSEQSQPGSLVAQGRSSASTTRKVWGALRGLSSLWSWRLRGSSASCRSVFATRLTAQMHRAGRPRTIAHCPVRRLIGARPTAFWKGVSGDLVCVEQVEDGMGEDFSGVAGAGASVAWIIQVPYAAASRCALRCTARRIWKPSKQLVASRRLHPWHRLATQ